MRLLPLACALALTACATTPGETPEQTAARAAQAAAIAKATYCSLPLETRKAVREKATEGLTLVVCPGDQ